MTLLTRSRNLFVLNCFALACLFSCKKVIDVPAPAEGPGTTRTEIKGSFTAKIDGMPFSAIATEALLYGDSILVYGVDAEGQKITLAVQGTVPGSYETNGVMSAAKLSKAGAENFSSSLVVSSGQIRIGIVDLQKEIIKGTFSFLLRSPSGQVKNVTDGRFEMNFEGSSPGTATGNEGPGLFYATVNGSLIKATHISTMFSEENISFLGIASDTTQLMLDIREDISAGNYHTEDSVKLSFSKGSLFFYADTTQPMQVMVTLHDLEKKKLKGTFAFTAKADNPDSSVQVTGGVFDLNY